MEERLSKLETLVWSQQRQINDLVLRLDKKDKELEDLKKELKMFGSISIFS